MDLIALFGRFHPVVLHLPIGALFTIAIAELWFLSQKKADRNGQLLFILYLFALFTAVLAIATGLALSEEDVYGGSTLDLHENLGIATGIVIIFAACFAFLGRKAHSMGPWGIARQLALIASLALVTITGHLGGEMTHGEDFLTEFGPVWLKPEVVEEETLVEVTVDTTVYEAAIEPIMTEYCVYCHDDETTKGGLRMDTIEHILAGGKGGPLFVPGDISESLMIERIHLPLEDEEHMPPTKKRQPSEAEVAALTWWVESGASFEMKLNNPAVPESVRALVSTQDSGDVVQATVGALDMNAIQGLRDQFITVQRIEQGSDLLWVDFSAVATTADDTLVEDLSTLAGNIAWLNLSRTQITDQALQVVREMNNLKDLDLRSTGITDAGLRQLNNVAYLSRLNLSDTQTSGSSLGVLEMLPAGANVHLSQTQLTQGEVEQLRASRPDLDINFVEPSKF